MVETQELTKAEASEVKAASPRHLDQLVKRLIRQPNSADIAEIVALPPKAKAYIARSPEFQDYLMSMALDAVLGFERMTRGQWKALAFFRVQGIKGRTIPARAIGNMDVQPQEAAEDE